MGKAVMRFYIKQIGDDCSIYHRISHQYLESAKTIEEAAQMVGELNALSDEGLWKSLIYDYKVKMPHKDVLAGSRRDTGWAESEEKYRTAWYVGTNAFYARYPELLVEEEVPYALLQHIELDRQKKLRKEDDERMERIRQATEEYDKPKVKEITVRESEREGIKQIVIHLAGTHKIIMPASSSPFK